MMWKGSKAAVEESRGARSRPVRQLVHDEMLKARIRVRRAQDERWDRVTIPPAHETRPEPVADCREKA